MLLRAHGSQRCDASCSFSPLPCTPPTLPPRPAACAGAKTSFKLATGLTLADAAARDRARLPESFSDGVFCDEWAYRLEAAARTWQRPHAQDNLM